jgi:FAD/FMN-containing dehydrogenase/Fe-S oxidoreductase
MTKPLHALLSETLRRAGIAEVDDSPRRRAEYSSDASLYRVVPSVVVFPRHADEIAATVDVCRTLQAPLTARGAGTSIAGNAVGHGVILDFSRHLNRIHVVDADSATAVVEPGVILDDLQRAAAPHRLRFGPDPSTHSRCTIGGMIGNNACGSRALGYGRTADNIVDLDIVTGTGERLHVAHDADPHSTPTFAALQQVIHSRLKVIRTEFGRFSRQVSGYSLEHLLPERGFDPAKALVGTEGTCGVVERATVRLVRAPQDTSLVVLGYPDLVTAAEAVPALLPFAPVALEGLDRRLVDALRHARGTPIPELPPGNGWLMVELGGDDPAEVTSQARRLAAEAQAVVGRGVLSGAEAAALWKIREDAAGLTARAAGGRPRLAGWEDAAVPPERLGAYLREFEALLSGHGLSGAPYGHFGDGCVHIRIDFALTEDHGRAVFRKFLVDAAKLVAAHGGSMSGEHGDGRARSELLPLMYSPAALEAFAEVKRVFDPDDVLNPGIVVRPASVDADVRLTSVRPVPAGQGFGYRDDGGDFAAAVHRCTGVGKCRVTTGSGMMCPSYRATHDEKDSTRGRARVLQELVRGTTSPDWRSAAVHEALDLCLGCKACSSECPTGVDMATYRAEALYRRYRHRPRPAAHYSLGWLPRWARLASRMPGLVNAALSSPLATAGKRLSGVDSRRPLPRFASPTFRQWFSGRAPVKGAPVMLWVDTFTNYFTPQVGIAAVHVLAEAGFSVRLPESRLCCGLTWISTGQLDAARRILGRSVASLAPTSEAGTPIVGLEPSCSSVFRGDAFELLGPTTEVKAVAGSFRTLAELLTETPGWQPPDLTGTTAVAQPHCHQRSVMGLDADRALLASAGVAIQEVVGCCGLAGNFGAERGHYELSVAVAENDLLPAVRSAAPGAVVLADGFSCRTQLDHLANLPGVHLAQLLAGERTER